MTTIDRFLSTEYAYARADLGIYRIFFCLYLLSGMPTHLWLKELPSFMFSPPISPTAWLNGFPPSFVYTTINIITAASAVALLLGITPRASSLVLSLSLLCIRAFAYSSGKINHDILIVVIPFIAAFSSWGKAFGISELRNKGTRDVIDDDCSVAILAFLIAFWMATAGWQKAVGDWLTLSYSVVYQDVLTNTYVTGRHTFFNEFAISTFPNWIWECFDWMTVFFELSGLLFVWKRRAFRVWLFAACFFHLGIDFFMLIPYATALIAYGAFVPWTQLSRYLPRPKIIFVSVVMLGIYCLSIGVPFLSIQRQIVWVAPIVAVALSASHFLARSKGDIVHLESNVKVE